MYLKMTEYIRFINCDKCGNWEQIDADEARHKSQHFQWVSYKPKGEAVYKCTCGNHVTSTTEEV